MLQTGSEEESDIENEVDGEEDDAEQEGDIDVGVAGEGAEESEEEKTPKDRLIEELAETLDEYISGDEETVKETIEYFIDAETVTKLPYIERADADEETLQGQVKFYRYDEGDEVYTADGDGNETLNNEHMLTFINQTDFNAKMQAYKSSGNEDVFKHFTLDQDGNVVIAYGSKEERTVTVEDFDITEEVVKEYSGENYKKDANGNFKKIEYNIFEKSIDYLSLVEEYIMPSNLLYALLIQTRDSNLVKDIASLAYQNEIAVGIYNNETQINITENYTYKKLMELSGETSINASAVATTDPIEALKNTISDDVEYTDITYTAISQITSTNISTKYPNMTKRCFFNTIAGKIKHQKEKYNLNKTTETTHEDMYIKETDSNGKVKTLGTLEDAKEFKITYTNQRNTESTPSVAVILADTWIAKWQASYSQEVEEKQSTSNNELEDDAVVEYTDKTAVINAFDTSVNVQTVLDEHANKLSESAIKQIVDDIDFTVTVEPELIVLEEIEQEALENIDDIQIEKKKELLEKHLEFCSNCQFVADEWWKWEHSRTEIPELTTEDVYDELTARNGRLEQTVVEEHYRQELQTYFDKKNKEIEEYKNNKSKIDAENERRKQAAADESKRLKNERKQKFQEELTNQLTTNQTLQGNQTYLSINATNETTIKKSLYKKDGLTENSNVGEKFSSVWKKNDYYKAKEALLARIEWFWEYIRDSEDTAKLENVIRHLLNIATESTDFGEFSDEEIKNLITAFNPREEMKAASETTSVLLTEYLHYWENSTLQQYLAGKVNYTSAVAKYITEDKQNYIITDDGAGNPVVGFGVDIYNGGFLDRFQAAGYDVSIGSQIPVEFVDALEEEAIEVCKEFINTLLSENSLEFTLYQKIALYSRAYNCGNTGATQERNDKTFVQAYTEYYNFEEDDNYGEVVKDFENDLYKNYMNSPTNPGSEVEQGLKRRRESEWILFNTGYFNVLDKWCGSANYPEGIKTFQASGMVFPEYPQLKRVGDTTLYAKERYGNPDWDTTLGSSGCGLFSMATILSGLLGDASIDPVTFRDAMEEYYGRDGGDAYRYGTSDNGSYANKIANARMLEECYGVTAEWAPSEEEALQGLKEGKCIFALEPGHFVAIVPVPNEYEGQGEIFVIDSARGETGIYESIDDYINQNKGKWGGKAFLKLKALISL